MTTTEIYFYKLSSSKWTTLQSLLKLCITALDHLKAQRVADYFIVLLLLRLARHALGVQQLAH